MPHCLGTERYRRTRRGRRWLSRIHWLGSVLRQPSSNSRKKSSHNQKGEKMSTVPFTSLIRLYRSDAERFRRRGLERKADLLEAVAKDIEDAVREHREEMRTVANAQKSVSDC